MSSKKEPRKFLAFDVQAFLEKIRREQMLYGRSLKHSAEVVERYNFLIAAVEAEQLICVVSEKDYRQMAEKKTRKKGARSSA